MAFAGKMERQKMITKKREQRHYRENIARKSQFVSDYIRLKYYNTYSEAEEFYNALKTLYPNKNDLKKTVEYATWKNQISNMKPIQIQTQPQEPLTQGTTDLKSSGQSTSTDRKHTDSMQLKIQLINCKPKTTTAIDAQTQETMEVIETGSSPFILEEISTQQLQENIDEVSTATAEVIEEEISTQQLQENIDEVSTATAEVIEEDISPFIREEISTELLQQIIADLNTEPYLKDMLSDFEMLGSDIDIDQQYTLEDELSNY